MARVRSEVLCRVPCWFESVFVFFSAPVDILYFGRKRGVQGGVVD